MAYTKNPTHVRTKQNILKNGEVKTYTYCTIKENERTKKNNIKVQCECLAYVNKYTMISHKRTKKHENRMNKIEEEIELFNALIIKENLLFTEKIMNQ